MSQFRRIAGPSIAALCAWIALFSMLGTGPAQAQETETPDNSQNSDESDDRTAIKRIDTIFVAPTKDGQDLLPVMGITLEEYGRLVQMEQEQRQPGNAPRYHFADMSITGNATENQVSLDLTLDIVTHEDRWVRVPLRLGSSVIASSEFPGAGKHYLEYDEEETAYYAWISAEEADTNHKLKLKLLDRISKTGNEYRLQLDLPRVVGTRGSPTLELDVPIEEAAGVASSGRQARPVEGKPNGKSTKLVVTQPAGEFSLSWRSTKAVPVASKPVVFDATSRVIVK